MADVKMCEVWLVDVSVDGLTPKVEPRGVEFTRWDEAALAIQRALAIEAATADDEPNVTVIVSKVLRRCDEYVEEDDLDDWPSERHIERKL